MIRETLLVMRAALMWMTAVALCLGCGGKVPGDIYGGEYDPRYKELVLGVGDTIAINVWENRDLNTETTIRADGMITMPLVGDLKAGGQTPSALKATILEQISKFVKVPETAGKTELVTISVKAWKSYKFTLQGEVVRQGVFSSEQFVTVAEAIAMAGGLTRFAKGDEMQLFRTDPKTKAIRKIPLNYGLLSSGKRLDMNIYVLAGDTIYVP